MIAQSHVSIGRDGFCGDLFSATPRLTPSGGDNAGISCHLSRRPASWPAAQPAALLQYVALTGRPASTRSTRPRRAGSSSLQRGSLSGRLHAGRPPSRQPAVAAGRHLSGCGRRGPPSWWEESATRSCSRGPIFSTNGSVPFAGGEEDGGGDRSGGLEDVDDECWVDQETWGPVGGRRGSHEVAGFGNGEDFFDDGGCYKRPYRPHRIILVRHGQSEGNVDESAYTRTPDSKVALTRVGWEQAVGCGRRIRRLVEGDGQEDWKMYFYVSPYRRTLQTLRGIGLNFERERIAGVREEPRLREQDFGNFQDREKMRVEKAIRLRYGRFFYRFPDGESAADVYDRITGFRETLRADIDVGRFQRRGSASRNMNLVLVSHGLTLRVFLMRWYKWTVEQFEGLYNFGNTGMMVMQLGRGGRYSLMCHHSREELRAFGMDDAMIADQEWQKTARPGELNPEWCTSGPSFFDHFGAMPSGEHWDYVPPDISPLCGEAAAGGPPPGPAREGCVPPVAPSPPDSLTTPEELTGEAWKYTGEQQLAAPRPPPPPPGAPGPPPPPPGAQAARAAAQIKRGGGVSGLAGWHGGRGT